MIPLLQKNIFRFIKFCLEHIIRNIVGKFSIPKEKVLALRKTVNGMQAASNYEKFAAKMESIAQLDVEDEKNHAIFWYYII